MKKQEAFSTFLATKAKDDWLVNFISDDWSYNSATKGVGLTLESLHIAEMLASLLKDKDLQEKVSAKLKAALEKLLSQTYEDENTWFIVTKNANEVDNTEMNLNILSVLNSSMQSISGVGPKVDQLVKFRNYFFSKAIGALSINDFNHAVRGLNKLNDYPFIHTESSTFINLGDTKA